MQTKNLNWLQRVLCRIGGAELEILEQCPAEKNKFIAIGIGVINTAMLSVFTMGYAMLSVMGGEIQTNNQLVAIIAFSLFWGFIIFGIDWGLITTMRKKAKYGLGSGLQLFFTTLFRLVVAAVISFTVSLPLETLVFKDYLPSAKNEMRLEYEAKNNLAPSSTINELDAQHNQAEDEYRTWLAQSQEAYGNDPFLPQLSETFDKHNADYEKQAAAYKRSDNVSYGKIRRAQASIDGLKKQITVIRDSSKVIDEYEQGVINKLEQEQTPYRQTTSKERGAINYRAKELKKVKNVRDRALYARNNRISEIDSVNQSINAGYQSTLIRIAQKNDSTVEGSARYEAQKVIGENKVAASSIEKNNLINDIIAVQYLKRWRNDPEASFGQLEISKKAYYTSLLLMILILVIDTAPIVIKLLVKRGEYDELRETSIYVSRVVEEGKRVRAFIVEEAMRIAHEIHQEAFAINVLRIEMSKEAITRMQDLYTFHTSSVDMLKEEYALEMGRLEGLLENEANPLKRSLLSELKEKLTDKFRMAMTSMNEAYRAAVS